MRVQSNVSVHHLPVSEEELLLEANFIPVEINPLLNSALAFSGQRERCYTDAASPQMSTHPLVHPITAYSDRLPCRSSQALSDQWGPFLGHATDV